MSKDLTDVDAFSSPIHVPEGTDSRNNAAGDVELIAQRLANRTYHLDIHSAKIDESNSFEGTQNFDEPSCSTPLFSSGLDAGDHPGAPANAFKLIDQWHCTDGTWVRRYIGDGTQDWIITANAAWNPASGAQTWAQDSGAQVSSCLWCKGDRLHFFNKAAGSGSWGINSWDNLGDLLIGGTLSVGNDVVVTGDITGVDISGSDIEAGNVMKAGVSFDYVTPPTRTIAISPLDYIGSAGRDIDGSGAPLLLAGEDAGYTVRVPHGAVLGNVRIKTETIGSDVNATVHTKRRYAVNFAATSPPSYDTIKALTGVTLALAGPGPIYNLTVADSGNLGFDGLTADKNESYQIWIKNNSGGGLSILALDYSIVDPGPRNY